jgi:hypothetical protein
VDRAEVAFDAAMNVAARGGDLEEVLRDLLHVCGHRRDAVESARARCHAIVTANPQQLDARRALELLDGALRTSLYAEVSR